MSSRHVTPDYGIDPDLWDARAKYAINPDLHYLRVAASPLAVAPHAVDQYRKRLPDDAVSPDVAWKRSESINHPSVLDTHRDHADSAHVYGHNGEYWAVFIVRDGAIKTVYNDVTHEYPPTQAYIRAHGPHYLESEESVDDE